MWPSILCLLALVAAPQSDSFTKEMLPLQTAVNAALTKTGATVMTAPKATYLDDYGVIVVAEVMLEPPPSPAVLFSSRPPSVKAEVLQRFKDLKDKLSELATQQIAKSESVGATESLAVVVHLLNSTRADTPELPAQVVVSVKKASPTQVNVKELR